jgi:hypothetical protein
MKLPILTESTGALRLLTLIGTTALVLRLMGPLTAPAVVSGTLLAPGGDETGAYGKSVAISPDGNTTLVGAPYSTIGANRDQGKVFVFNRAGAWSLIQELTSSDGAENDSFGYSIAASEDGNTLVVGAPYKAAENREGAVYIFSRNEGAWTEQAIIHAPDGTSYNRFGYSVSISGDTVAIGAPENNGGRGSVYIYTGSGGTWMRQHKITHTLTWTFGFSVAIGSDTVVVGTSGDYVGAYVYNRTGTAWPASPAAYLAIVRSDYKSGDGFGYSVAIDPVGDAIVVGAPWWYTGSYSIGHAYIFARSGADWTEQKILAATAPQAGAEFGASVGISRDGSTVMVGEPWRRNGEGDYTGATYAYTRGGSVWTEQQKVTPTVLNSKFGTAVAVNQDGKHMVVGAPGANRAYAYSGIESFTISVSYNVTNYNADPYAADWIHVTGGGAYNQGETVQVGAYADDPWLYDFIGWTENGTVISTSPYFSFTAGDTDRHLVAIFARTGFMVTWWSDPEGAGEVDGYGDALFDDYYVTAVPNEGYRFTHWTIEADDATINPYEATVNPLGLYMDRDYTVTARFERIPVAVTTASLPDGLFGAAYSWSLEASGGITPYTWSIISGSLPAGMELNWNIIEGIPNAAGTATFTVQVTDSDSSTPSISTKELFVTIDKATPAVDVTGGSFTYDGRPHASAVAVTGVGGEPVAGSITITYSGAGYPSSTTPPINTGTYTVSAKFASSDGNYSDSAGSGNLNISKAPVAPTVAVNDKTYDGTVLATIAARSLSGVIEDDHVTLENGVAAFYDSNAGMGKPVSVTSLALGGTHAGNYQLSATDASATASISKTTASVFVSGGPYEFDGSPHGAAATATGVGGNAVTGTFSFTYDGKSSEPIDVGTYEVVASFTSGDSNYHDAVGIGVLIIGSTPGPLTIFPTSRLLRAGGTLQLLASEEVEWSVRAVPGVDTGSFSASGLYTAPARVPPSGGVLIYAESTATGKRVSLSISIFSGAADGTFGEGMSLPVPSGATGYTLGTYLMGDIGGDGLPDVLILGTHREVNGLFYYSGEGDGTFALTYSQKGYQLPGLSNPKKIWLQEVTGDGYPDLIDMRDNDGDGGFDETRVFQGDGTGKFTRLWGSRDGFATPATGGQPSPILLFSDANNDGNSDLIQAGSGGSISVRFNDGEGRFSGAGGANYPTGGATFSYLFASDQNGDGHIDLVAFNQASTLPSLGPAIKVFLNDGFGGFAGLPLIKPWGDGYYLERGAPLFGDFTADGIGDLLVAINNVQSGRLHFFQGLSDGTFADPVILEIVGTPKAVLHANDDHHLDLLVLSRTTQAGVTIDTIELWLGDGEGSFSRVDDVWQTGRRILDVAVTELNGDNQYDLVIRMTPEPGAIGYVIGTLVGGNANAAAPSLRLYPDPQHIVNLGEPSVFYLKFGADQTGVLDPDLKWYVNEIQNGDATVGTMTVVDDYLVKYLPPNDNDSLAGVTIEVRNADGTLSESASISFTHYKWEKISEFALPSQNSRLAWAADGSRLYAVKGADVFWSGDGGISWSAASGGGTTALPGGTINSLLVDPDDSLTVYVGLMRFIVNDKGYGGVYKTTDGGETWRQVHNGLPTTNLGSNDTQPYVTIRENTLAMGGTITGGRVLYAGAVMQSLTDGLYRSEDGGENWRQVDIAGGQGLIGNIVVDPDYHQIFELVTGVAAVSPGSPVVYVISRLGIQTGDGDLLGNSELYKSTDGGQNWVKIQGDTAPASPSHVAVDPLDELHVIVTGAGVFDSRDGGITWLSTTRDIGPVGSYVVFSPTTAGIMLTGSTYLSTLPDGVHWHRFRAGLVQGVAALSPTAVAIAPAGAPFPGALYAATSAGIFSATIIPEDSVPPYVAIRGPTTDPTFSTNSSTITLEGTATGNVSVILVHWATDRRPGDIATGTNPWTATVPLEVGVNTITVTAIDAAGNSGTATLTVTYNPPPLTISIAIARVTGDTFGATVSTHAGYTYILEYKNSLMDAIWTVAHTVTGTGGEITLSDTGATAQQRFYRVKVVPID